MVSILAPAGRDSTALAEGSGSTVKPSLATFGPAPEPLEQLVLGIAPQRIETAD
ncbi:hypothetical protein ABTZ59_34645 [Streptomyces sp. NPDC094034]|uniref:hypothetical protein n=1 Tax=Streptomyces sp. NPDC094034 TaxID=3155309 RepID=UPI0033267155